MSKNRTIEQPITVNVTNIGGIDESTITIDTPTTVLTGRNASNRTSMLQAIMAACGTERVTLKGDAETGSVKLSTDDEDYTRTLERHDGTILTGGNPLLDAPELADRFAFLLESNEARRAIARDDDLRDVLLGPVDTEAIETEIEQLQGKKRDIEAELEEIEKRSQEIPNLEQRRQSLESRIEEIRQKLDEKETEIDDSDGDLNETQDDKSKLEDKLAELREAQSSLEDVRYRINTEEESIENVRSERSEVATKLESIPETSTSKVDEIDAELERLRNRRSAVDSELSKLQSVIEFNQEMLEGTESTDIIAVLQNEELDGSVTDQLAGDESVVCWTCGTEVARDEIEETLKRLRDLHREKVDEISAFEDEIEDLNTERKELQRQIDRRSSLEQRAEKLDNEIEDRQDQLTKLTDRRDDFQKELEELETAVELLEEEVYDEILELHREKNQLEFKLNSLKSDREEVDETIQSIEARLDEREAFETQLEEVRDEITEVRTKMERLEKDAVEKFNTHVDEVLDRLDYENITRIWIERVERDVRKGNRKTTESQFVLHVVRETDGGATYEDTIEHLSESEREVVGLIFALAGYLVHEVYEECPFMILDSLEALDSTRIASLVDYLQEYADYLVVALLTEDAEALDESYQRITEI